MIAAAVAVADSIDAIYVAAADDNDEVDDVRLKCCCCHSSQSVCVSPYNLQLMPMILFKVSYC